MRIYQQKKKQMNKETKSSMHIKNKTKQNHLKGMLITLKLSVWLVRLFANASAAEPMYSYYLLILPMHV